MNALQPANIQEVAAIVAEGRPLEVLGRGSKRTLGHAVNSEASLQLSRLDSLTFYEPDEMVVSVGAGMELSSLERTLAGRRQRLAFAPPNWSSLLADDPTQESESQSIGGIVATNLSGSARLSAGAARDHLIGFTAVNGRGEIFKSGGRVVKNVTGYDLSKLMCGSFGTLAVLTELVLRVLPVPEYEATLLLPSTATEAIAGFAAALGGPYEVAAAAWLPGALSPAVGLQGDIGLLRLEGLEPSVRERCIRLADHLGTHAEWVQAECSTELWRALGNGTPLATEQDSAIWRVSVPPSQGAALLADFPLARGWLDWAGGLVWLALPNDGSSGAHALRNRISAWGGHATLIRASTDMRGTVPVFQPQSPALAELTTRVKTSFDPANLLNRGRMG